MNYEALFDESYKRGDLWDEPKRVIPIKTRGRAYGSISQHAVQRGLRMPDLASLTATHVEGDNVFVVLWDDASDYTPELIYGCAFNAVVAAGKAGFETLAMPLLGGKVEGFHRRLDMVRGVEAALDRLDELELTLPRVKYVGDREIVA
jgi:hypothetical protein